LRCANAKSNSSTPQTENGSRQRRLSTEYHRWQSGVHNRFLWPGRSFPKQTAERGAGIGDIFTGKTGVGRRVSMTNLKIKLRFILLSENAPGIATIQEENVLVP
jgi:hypothetical protein